MTPLPPGFLDRPLAHRGRHGAGRPENSLPAVRAAVAGGWGIEIDVRPSADGVAVVIHDATLDRTTTATGAVSERTAADLAKIPLVGASATVPMLADVLDAVGGRVPLLVELKDGAAPAAARALADYDGPAAVMAFDPEAVARMAALAPDLPRGLVTCAFGPEWPLPPARRAALADAADAERVGAAFVSHDHRDLDRPRLADLRRGGLAILCWTIRSPQEATAARRRADQITFEGFDPDEYARTACRG